MPVCTWRTERHTGMHTGMHTYTYIKNKIKTTHTRIYTGNVGRSLSKTPSSDHPACLLLDPSTLESHLTLCGTVSMVNSREVSWEPWNWVWGLLQHKRETTFGHTGKLELLKINTIPCEEEPHTISHVKLPRYIISVSPQLPGHSGKECYFYLTVTARL